MPGVTPTTGNGLTAALLLARGRSAGVVLLSNDLPTALFSFRAALICLPIFALLRLLVWSLREEPAAGTLVVLLAEAIGYVLSWTAFALISRLLAEQAGRLEAWPRFIAAWNWVNVVHYLLLSALVVPMALGFPPFLGVLIGLLALGYALWLEYFVVRSALEAGRGTPVMFVSVNLFLGLLIGGMVARVSGG